MSRQHTQKRPIGQYLKDVLTLFGVFFKIGLFSFGGGYAMLTLIEAEVVDKHKWITKSELGDIFAIAESTPGPIAVNTATFIGTKQFGILGGIFATFGVVLPSFIIISVLSVILNLVKDNKWVNFLFRGIRVGVLVLIAKAVLSFFKDMRKTIFSFALMAISFVLVFFFDVDVIYVILGTIFVCSVAVAVTTYVRNRRYHTVGTAEYYNEREGKPLDKDEYFSQKAVDTHEIIIKTPNCDENSINGEANDYISCEENQAQNDISENTVSDTDCDTAIDSDVFAKRKRFGRRKTKKRVKNGGGEV
ncbi:MAG: chromate transporter [Clostridia bacterium]|nr:chromate transporter [Clostridia bacterium]